MNASGKNYTKEDRGQKGKDEDFTLHLFFPVI